MNKQTVHQLIIDKLRVDLDIAERAAQTAYETATHEENIAENKYDTLGLEASYLAAGQAKRVEEIRQSLALCQNLTLRAYDENRGIEVGALLGLDYALDENNKALVTEEMHAQVQAAADKIKSGDLVVHDYMADNACPAASF